MSKVKKRQSAGNPSRARTSPADVRTDFVCLALILLAASILILANLGNQYLWGDEAATALVSKTILTNGIPIGTDGRNFFSQLSGAECTRNMVWVWHPWFPFYLQAMFFGSLGVSTFTARLPFALLGIATVMLALYFGRSLWRNREAGIYSAVLLMVSVPFLILVRQSRYYSPEIFLSLLGLYGYHLLVESRRKGAVILGLAGVLLFNTHYVQCAVLLAAVIIHSLIFRREKIRPVLITSAVVAVLSIPGILMFAGASQVISTYGNLMSRTLDALGAYCGDIGRYVLHPAILLIPIFFAATTCMRTRHLPAYNMKTADGVWLLVIFSILTVVAASITGQSAYFRYIGPMIPAACLIAGLIIASTNRLHWAVGIVLVAGIAYWTRMPLYLYEITHDYQGPARVITEYLNEHGKDTDVVAVNHEDLPIKFYTKMRVVSGVTGEDWAQADGADWVILRRSVSSKERRFTNYMIQCVRKERYQPILLDCPDIPFENREDPKEHFFKTPGKVSPVMILRKMK